MPDLLHGIACALHAVAMQPPPYDIQERTFVFSCRAIDFCRPLFRGDPINRHLARQLLHASTSVGANLEEADAGHTKPDFRNKISTSRKECREARYWLRLMAYSKPHLQTQAAPLIDETSQLVKILTTIKLNSEGNTDRG
jgi:S23 ribosomal protein.